LGHPAKTRPFSPLRSLRCKGQAVLHEKRSQYTLQRFTFGTPRGNPPALSANGYGPLTLRDRSPPSPTYDDG